MRLLLLPALAALLAAGCWGSDPVRPDDVRDRLVWSAPLPGEVEGEVAVGAGVIFAATDSGLAALALESGAQKWFVRVAGLSASKRVLARGPRVLTAASGAVRAHSAESGAVLWERAFDLVRDHPASAELAADDEMMFVGLRSGSVLALSQADGRTLWEARVETPEWSYAGQIAGSTLAGDTLYVAATRYLTANGYEETVAVVALDRATGRELWRYEYGGRNMSVDHAVVVTPSSLLFTDGYQSHVVGLDRATGAERWVIALSGFFFAPPVVRGDTTFVASSASRAYALSTETGAMHWSSGLEAGATSVGICGTELFVGNFHVQVLAASDGRRLGLAFTGDGDEIVTSRMIVRDGVVYVGTNKRLMAFRCAG